MLRVQVPSPTPNNPNRIFPVWVIFLVGTGLEAEFLMNSAGSLGFDSLVFAPRERRLDKTLHQTKFSLTPSVRCADKLMNLGLIGFGKKRQKNGYFSCLESSETYNLPKFNRSVSLYLLFFEFNKGGNEWRSLSGFLYPFLL